MPLVFRGISQHQAAFVAWRWAFFVPGAMHVLAGMVVLFLAQDLPDGNYALLKKKGVMSKDSGVKIFLNACRNYRCAPA